MTRVRRYNCPNGKVIQCKEHDGCPIAEGQPPTVETCARFLHYPNWVYTVVGKKGARKPKADLSESDYQKMAQAYLEMMLGEDDEND